jgi:diketogulonate reductase-like aldo/keto reductase
MNAYSQVADQPIIASERRLRFPGRIGLGTWQLGETAANYDRDVGSVTHALDIGYRLVDTAEMYGDGGAERVIGSALRTYGRSRRCNLFIVSKVTAQHASAEDMVRSCEASIKRMGCDYLDLYLLHWPGVIPFVETLQGFATLMQRKLIRNLGVSNFSVDDLQRWLLAEKSVDMRATLQCNQLPYSADARGFESILEPWQRGRGIQTMAYWPLGRDGHAALAGHQLLERLGRERSATAAQIALAWCVREPGVVAIAKSAHHDRLEENLRAGALHLNAAEIRQINQAFPVRLKWLRQLLWLQLLRSRVGRITH